MHLVPIPVDDLEDGVIDLTEDDDAEGVACASASAMVAASSLPLAVSNGSARLSKLQEAGLGPKDNRNMRGQIGRGEASIGGLGVGLAAGTHPRRP